MFVTSRFSATVLVAGLVMSDLVAQAAGVPGRKWASIKYSTVTGFFAQDLPTTDDATFDFVSSNFGLLNEFQFGDNALDTLTDGKDATKPQWSRFADAIKQLNKNAPKDTQYKVLYLARHGQGHHNVAESFYGTHLWDCYWSLLDGNGTSRWDDAHLTGPGIAEAKIASSAWKTQITHKIPLPEIWYSSPMTRAAQTLEYTWKDITLNKKQTPKPIIKEKLRETMGVHTCDRRSTKCDIARAFPGFTFEDSFVEGPDPLWDPVVRETEIARNFRLRTAIDEILASDDSQAYISITAHSGAIKSLLEVFGHRAFKLQTGGMIPVVLKVEYQQEKQPVPTLPLGGSAPRCTIDPTPVPVVNA